MKIIKRTFEAKNAPVGTLQREQLNLDARTSEYMPSYKYLLVGENFERSFKTKREAQQVMDQLQKTTQ